MEAKDTSTTGRKLRPSTMVIGLGLAGILAFQGYRYLANQGEEKTPLEPIDSIGTLNTGVEDSANKNNQNYVRCVQNYSNNSQNISY